VVVVASIAAILSSEEELSVGAVLDAGVSAGTIDAVVIVSSVVEATSGDAAVVVPSFMVVKSILSGVSVLSGVEGDTG
jgi:hypothetical protein